jgi:hypothetical protein
VKAETRTSAPGTIADPLAGVVNTPTPAPTPVVKPAPALTADQIEIARLNAELAKAKERDIARASAPKPEPATPAAVELTPEQELKLAEERTARLKASKG